MVRYKRPRKRIPLSERFWPKVRKTTGCWEWIGGRSASGYGSLRDGHSRPVNAHRLSWQLTYGIAPPADLWVLHACDNRLCVRPDHLFLGSAAENSADMTKKGRAASGARNSKRLYPWTIQRGEDNGHAKLTGANVEAIRMACARGERQRDIAQKFGISQSQVSNLVRGSQWRHLANAAAYDREGGK